MSYVRSGSARRVASWVQSTSSAGKTTVIWNSTRRWSMGLMHVEEMLDEK